MAVAPQPLEVGTEIASRFEIVHVLGSGGFGITYEALDRQADQTCVLKELAPMGSVRQENGDLHFTLIGPEAIQRCRRQFESESRLLRSLKLKGVIPAYAECIAHGTVYMAMKLIPGAITLQELFNRSGVLNPAAAEEILRQVLTTLGLLHVRGILHRDIKPSNLLIDPEGDVSLIDFGSAREWVADITQYQTVEFTPGYAPIEQLSEAARRGPGTDLYSLAATIWYLLVGRSPISATDRASGIHAPSLESLRADCPKNLARAIQQALELRLTDRPHTAQEMLNLLDGINEDPTEENDWAVLDNTLNEIQLLKFGKLECPCCGDVLASPKPLKSGTCIVCRHGPIKNRNLDERRCAVCKVGVLRPTKNGAPLHFCPACKVGELVVTRSKLLQRRKGYQCSACNATYESTPSGVMIGSGDGPFKWEELREVSGRGALVFICDHCHANFDEQIDGRWSLQPTNRPEMAYSTLYPSEWARVASNLDPGAGNAYCPTCAADYFVEGDSICLLNVHEDPYNVGEVALDVVMSRERATWVGAGKSSGHLGLSCSGCAIELDPVGDDQYELGRPPTLETLKARRLQATSTIAASMTDWHRLARGLPKSDQDDSMREAIHSALVTSYTTGQLKLDMIWEGFVEIDAKVVPLKVSKQGFTLGKWLGKSRLAWSDIEDIRAEGHDLQLDLGQDSMTMLVQPMELEVSGKAQTYRLSIGATELADRIQNTLLS